MQLQPDLFTTCAVTFRLGDSMVTRRIWSYETQGEDAALFDVSHDMHGSIIYRRDMGTWSYVPSSGVHDEIVRFFRIIPGENSGDRLC